MARAVGFETVLQERIATDTAASYQLRKPWHGLDRCYSVIRKSGSSVRSRPILIKSRDYLSARKRSRAYHEI